DAARAGDEIRLESGASFTGNFVLPVFEGETAVTLRTDVPDPPAPRAAHRGTPASASRFARIVSPNARAALRTAPGAHHWQLPQLQFPAQTDRGGDIH